jgi:hypothetical protein
MDAFSEFAKAQAVRAAMAGMRILRRCSAVAGNASPVYELIPTISQIGM